MRALPWMLLMACTGGPDAEPPPVEPAAAEANPAEERAYVLDDPAYRFCHEAGPYSEDLRPFCGMVDEVDPERCPGFHELCARSERDDVSTQIGGGCGGGMGAPPVAPAGAPEPPSGGGQDWTPSSSSCDPPQTSLGWLGRVMQWVIAGIIALVVLVFIRLVLWAVAQRRRRDDADAAPVTVQAPVVTSVEADEVPDLPSDDLLAAAETALNEGRTEDAILIGRAAALRHLADKGVVRLHRSRTDREYLRSLRRREEVHGPLRTVVSWVEQLRWGGSRATSDSARDVLSAVRRLITTVSLFALAVLAIGADGTYRYSPQGDAGIAELYAGAGYTVDWRLRSLSSIDDSTDVLIIDLGGIAPSDDDWSAIRSWVREGGVLLVGGAAEVPFPKMGEPVTVSTARVQSPWDVQTPTYLAPNGVGWAPGGVEAVVETVPNGDVLVGALFLGDGIVYGISESRLLWNAALVSQANEHFLLDLVSVATDISVPPEDVHIQLALVASAGSDNPLETLWNARLLPVMLQLMLVLGLAALWLGWPFAPLRDPTSSQRQHFSDHVTALGARYRSLKARAFVTRAYAQWVWGRYGESGLQARAERTGMTHQEARTWVGRVRAMADGDLVIDDETVLEDLWKTTHQE